MLRKPIPVKDEESHPYPNPSLSSPILTYPNVYFKRTFVYCYIVTTIMWPHAKFQICETNCKAEHEVSLCLHWLGWFTYRLNT